MNWKALNLNFLTIENSRMWQIFLLLQGWKALSTPDVIEQKDLLQGTYKPV